MWDKSKPDFFTVFVITFIIVCTVGIPALIIWGGITDYQNRVTSGEVIDKRIYQGYAIITGTDGHVSGHAQETSYYLVIQGERRNGEIGSYWHEVSEAEYDRYNIGDWYGRSKQEEE